MTSYVLPAQKYEHRLILSIKADTILPPAPTKAQASASSTPASSASAAQAAASSTLALSASAASAAPKKEAAAPSQITNAPAMPAQYLQDIEARYKQLSSDERSKWDGIRGKYLTFLTANQASMFIKLDSPISGKQINKNPDAVADLFDHQNIYAVFCFLGANMEGQLSRVEIEALIKTCMSFGAISSFRRVCANSLDGTPAQLTDAKLIDFLFSLTVNDSSTLESRKMKIVAAMGNTIASLQSAFASISENAGRARAGLLATSDATSARDDQKDGSSDRKAVDKKTN